jgi:hypothetical protein
MTHTIVKVKMEGEYPYNDFLGWYGSLESSDKEFWLFLAKATNRSEANIELLTKKAMELYCLEMGIDYIPNSEDYLEKIYRRLINNLNLASMIDRGLVALKSGNLTFLSEPDVYITGRGKNFMIKKD